MSNALPSAEQYAAQSVVKALDVRKYEQSAVIRGAIRHQEKKSASGRTGCVQTHQALGTLWMHPGRAHTAPNAKRTGNVNSDAARHRTVYSHAVCRSALRPDAARHGICLPDGACQGIFLLDAAVSGHFPSGCSRVSSFSFWTQPCQSIFLLGAAVSGQMASG